MKRKFFGMLLMGAMAIASVGMFTSCKDYDDDINNLQKQIDGITAQKLQDQLNTLKTAADAAKKAADDAQATANTAVANAKAADDAAKAAQGTADAAAKAAEAAQKAAEAAQATANAAATKEYADQIKKAIDDLTPIVEGKVAKADFDAAISKVEAEIAAINEKLLTLADVEELLKEKDFATNAALNDLAGQVEALEEFKAGIEALGPIGDKAWQAKVDAAIKAIAAIQEEIYGAEATEEAEAVKGLKQKMEEADEKIQSLDNAIKGAGSSINILNIFLKRDLKSLVLRPSMYYGGIEGVNVDIFNLPEEVNNPHNAKDLYRYFERTGNVIPVSDFGEAKYHVNPSNVDLTNFSIDFYNHRADINGPAVFEDYSEMRYRNDRQARTRACSEDLTDGGYIYPVYDTTEALEEAGYGVENGILTIPFKAKNANAIEAALLKGQGTIASLSMTKVGKEGAQDTTVNSDYAIVVPRYGYGLLIGDNMFEDGDAEYTDQIGLDNGVAKSENLHRNFSFLALAATAPTHKIKYNGKFNISAVLESRIVKLEEDWKAIKDTAKYVACPGNHQATAEWDGEKTSNPDLDGDCSIDVTKVITLGKNGAPTMERLGLKYEIQPVNYVLGSTKTGETVHLTLETDEDGDVWARPCNVTADGETIVATEENPANEACVGRQPIVCIMVKDANNKIVSFAYMKFLITPEDPETPEDHAVEFKLDDIYVNCQPVDGKVTWSQIEYYLLDQELGGVSKKTFDEKYVFDYYEEIDAEEIDDKGATIYTVTRKGYQYDKDGNRLANARGVVSEEWNKSKQGVEDATTHIIKWTFTADELAALGRELMAAKKLEEKENDWVNTEDIVTYVRYASLPYEAGKDSDPTKGAPSIWVKLVLEAGKLHVAKGNMDGSKILTYWYGLNSKTNAVGTGDANEVRINVPVPVPTASETGYRVGYGSDVNIVGNGILGVRYDNLLEKASDPNSRRNNPDYSEFTKDLKDFFLDGQLTASVADEENFDGIDDMKLGCEFVLPSTTIGNATFNAGKNHGIDNSWTVQSYSGAEYTLILDATRTKIQIKAKNNTVYPVAKDLITLNNDNNEDVDSRQITVVNYVNGEDQDDILNYKTHNELGERETFTAYLQIVVVNACAPVYWDNMWFNARFLRPLDLENPTQALAPDAPNNWKTIDLTDALIVKDWRDYYGDRKNRTQGKDVKLNLPGVGSQKAFDYAYYQVKIEIDDEQYYTDGNLGTGKRSDNFTLGHMPVIESADDADDNGYVLTSRVPNLKLEKISDTKLRYVNNGGVTGGFHVFVPVTMTYVFGSQTVKQTKWVTLGVTSSVNQVMFE